MYKVITGTLTSRTAIHVGSGETGELTDALMRRDAAGRPVIPGTAIAGALRAQLTRLAPRLPEIQPCAALRNCADSEEQKACKCEVCKLFGDLCPTDDEDSSVAASRLLVFNASMIDASLRSCIRDGVGIDRITRCASRSARAKFDLEILPAGASFTLRMELRDLSEIQEVLLGAALAEWKAGRLWLGGRVARGLGAFAVNNVKLKTRRLEMADELLAFLQDNAPWEHAIELTGWVEKKKKVVLSQVVPLTKINAQSARIHMASRWVHFEGVLQAQGPVLTNDPAAAVMSGFDHAPLVSDLSDWLSPVLPGAGIRGVLRTHCERIARTLAGAHAEQDAQTSDSDNDSLARDIFLKSCPACNPLENRHEVPLASCDALLKEKGFEQDQEPDEEMLCLGCLLFGNQRTGSRLSVEDAPYRKTRRQERPLFKMLDFLAIDRFTGGGKEGAKFDALTFWRPAFEFRMQIENPKKWELGWLALALRDMQCGWLRFGMGAAKGFGQMKLEQIKGTLGYLTEEDAKQVIDEPLGLPGDGIYHEMAFDLSIAQPWIDAFLAMQCNRSADKLPELKKDAYFSLPEDTDRIDKIYPFKEVL